MRDYLIILIVLASLPIGLFRPFYGLLVYAWISYMNPHMLAWSFGRDFPVARVSAMGLLAGALFHRDGDSAPLFRRENLLMVLLLATFTLSSLFAIYPDRAWAKWFDMLKIITLSLVSSTLLCDPKRLRVFFLVIAFSLGFYGFKGGIFGLVTGGEHLVWGPGDSIIGANNAIGLALNMCLPMLWYLANGEKSRRIKLALLGTFVLTIPAIMFTYSRASALGLAAVIMCIILKSRHRVVAIGLVLAVVILALPFLPQSWINRQQSTLEYESDTSATSRLDEWRFCWRVAMDRPVGGGFLLYSDETYMKYFPEFLQTHGRTLSAHSIYFGVLAEHGFPGFAVFLILITATMLSLYDLKRKAKQNPGLQWAAPYCDMIQVSLVGFLVNGGFVEMEYFDLFYQWVAVVASLKVVAAKELAASPVESGDLVTRTVPRAAAWQPSGFK